MVRRCDLTRVLLVGSTVLGNTVFTIEVRYLGSYMLLSVDEALSIVPAHGWG